MSEKLTKKQRNDEQQRLPNITVYKHKNAAGTKVSGEQWVSIDNRLIKAWGVANHIPRGTARGTEKRTFIPKRHYNSKIVPIIVRLTEAKTGNAVSKKQRNNLSQAASTKKESKDKLASQQQHLDLLDHLDFNISFKVVDAKALDKIIYRNAGEYNPDALINDIEEGTVVRDIQGVKGKLCKVEVFNDSGTRKLTQWSLKTEDGRIQLLPKSAPFAELRVTNEKFKVFIPGARNTIADDARELSRTVAANNMTVTGGVHTRFQKNKAADMGRIGITADTYETRWLIVGDKTITDLNLQEKIGKNSRVGATQVWVKEDSMDGKILLEAIKKTVGEKGLFIKEVPFVASRLTALRNSVRYDSYFLQKTFTDLPVSVDGEDGVLRKKKLRGEDAAGLPTVVTEGGETLVGNTRSRYDSLMDQVKPPSFVAEIKPTCDCCKEKETEKLVSMPEGDKQSLCNDEECYQTVSKEFNRQLSLSLDNQQDAENANAPAMTPRP